MNRMTFPCRRAPRREKLPLWAARWQDQCAFDEASMSTGQCGGTSCQLAGGSREIGLGAVFFLGLGFGAGLSPDGVGTAFGVAACFAAAGFAVFFLSDFGFDSSDAAPGAGGFVPV